MNYIVYDLEFNQKYLKDDKPSDLQFEIIQIGALKLNENLDTISTFSALVKPTVYTQVNPYIEILTKITTEEANLHNTFPSVYNDFINFIGTDEFTLCIWGTADIKELIKNLEFHNLDDKMIVKKYIDVQKIASTKLNTPKGTRIGLKNAIEFFNMPIESDFHNAFNDAFYTAEIFKKLYSTSIESIDYTAKSYSKIIINPKKKVDTTKLINQFEKIYNREMTDEEKAIIKLAYIMGKTNQFLI